jgi:transposase
MNSAAKNGSHPELPSTQTTTGRPDPQVTQRAARRRFTAADKLRILAEADACQPGQLGALLRREGLYSSTLANFRKQRDEGKLGRDPNQLRQQRRDKEAARQRDRRQIVHLEAENKKLKILLELQKKVAELISLDNPIDA